MILQRVLFGTSLAIVANGILLIAFSYGWSLQEPGVDRDFGWGFPWVSSAIAATLLAVPGAFLVGPWQRLVSWWAPSVLFAAISLAVAGIATACTYVAFWVLSQGHAA